MSTPVREEAADIRAAFILLDQAFDAIGRGDIGTASAIRAHLINAKTFAGEAAARIIAGKLYGATH